MAKSISSAHQMALSTARENLILQREAAQRQAEVLRAKWIQKQTGCTWTEALRAAAQANTED
jgi:hypothetical protein